MPGTRALSGLETISLGWTVRPRACTQKRLLVNRSGCLQGASSEAPWYGGPDFTGRVQTAPDSTHTAPGQPEGSLLGQDMELAGLLDLG